MRLRASRAPAICPLPFSIGVVLPLSSRSLSASPCFRESDGAPRRTNALLLISCRLSRALRRSYADVAYPAERGVALVVGSEVTGVDPAVMALCDGVVEIPTYGVKNSLNVAAAAPIVVYEVLRQWKARDAPTP